MKLGQAFKMAAKSIFSNIGRSALTMLGIIIGLAAVIIGVSLMHFYASTRLARGLRKSRALRFLGSPQGTTAVVLGSAYGTLMVSGLFTVQRAAHRDDLGRLTAVYYSFTYLGFFAPFVISVLSKVAPQQYVMMFGMVVALLTALATALAGLSPRRPRRARRRLR